MNSGRLRVFTVGHSNHTADEFLDVLARNEIVGVADVRSQPYSRYARHFGRENLESILKEAGLDYRYFGRDLGGRPEGPELYDEAGRLLYDRAAARPEFGRALERLCEWAAVAPVAIMCGEGDPSGCHRRHLVARNLEATGNVEVVHVLRDGGALTEAELCRRETPPQMELFGD